MNISRFVCMFIAVLVISGCAAIGYAELEQENQGEEVKSVVATEDTEPTAEPNEETPPTKITLFRTTPEKSLSKAAVKKMIEQNNFFCKEYHWSKGYSNPSASGFLNKFEKQKNNAVIYDHKSGLTWHQSGSDDHMTYEKVKTYIAKLNRDRFAGYSDWRLPTLEEAMSLLEPTKNKKGLYIDSIFDNTQGWIFTSDKLMNTSIPWSVDFSSGCFYYSDDADLDCYVRAVR